MEAATSLKDISTSQWYEGFSKVGLCYGPIFQGLSSVKASSVMNRAEAKIKLKPTAEVVQHESRYIIHPAALDAAIQLSIVSAHSGSPTKFKRAYMPVTFESIKIWPRAVDDSDKTIRSIANGTLKGVRGLSSDLLLLGAQKSPILVAKNIFLIASDQNALTLSNTDSPYARMIWTPRFDEITNSTIAALYPPIALRADAIIPSLNELALFQLTQFRATNPKIFETGSKVSLIRKKPQLNPAIYPFCTRLDLV